MINILEDCTLHVLTEDIISEVIAFYQKNGFKTLFTTELQEDIYTDPPLTEEEKTMRIKSPRKLKTWLMYKDMLS